MLFKNFITIHKFYKSSIIEEIPEIESLKGKYNISAYPIYSVTLVQIDIPEEKYIEIESFIANGWTINDYEFECKYRR